MTEWLEKPFCGCTAPLEGVVSVDMEYSHSADDQEEFENGDIISQRNTKITASTSVSDDGFFTAEAEKDKKEEKEAHSSCSIGNSISSCVARNPCSFLWLSLISSLTLSAVGYFVGDFAVTADLDGWLSRGTLIANQNTQTTLVNRNTIRLFEDGPAVWNKLTTEVQGTLTSHDPTQRRLSEPGEFVAASSAYLDLPGCDVAYYTDGRFLDNDENLWPVWQTVDESVSALDPPVIRDICIAEVNTQAILEDAGLCGGCVEGCLPPLSLVSFARVLVGDTDVSMDCDTLAAAWENSLPLVKAHLSKIVADMREGVHDPNSQSFVDVSNPLSAVALFVDSEYGIDGNDKVRYTSSIFATVYSGKPVEEVFAVRDKLDRAQFSELVTGAYDTAGEDFSKLVTDSLLISDMKLVTASLLVTTLAILVHTRSIWLTFVGLTQIALSFPLAYFFYSIVFGLSFFPFLNFIGFFVVFAIGADDIFVAVDKWKNARLDHPSATIAEVATVALPSAAKAMLVTTLTTAIAFLATAICPVPALKLFAIFSGLLIVFDYVLCLLLIFPALCIFDRYLCCDALWWCKGSRSASSNESCIRRFLGYYYMILHRFRYLWLVVIIVATVGCSLVATKLRLPNTSEVRLLRPTHEFERNYSWRLRSLVSELEREKGTRVWLTWGVLPADTGDHKNPRESSTMVLDETFDPSPVENQLYLRDFCSDLYSQPFAADTTVDDDCPLNLFDQWLKSESAVTNQSDLYRLNCHNATQLPLPPKHFHACMIGYAKTVNNKRILFNEGKVKILRIPFRQIGVLWDVGQKKMEESWSQLDDFTTTRNSLMAPHGVDRVYGTSHDFWWYDTNASILSTAAGSIAIALSAAFVVVFLSTLSVAVTLFAVFSIAFILLSSTAILVYIGWTLGFLESVCFAILVGVSCDFVLHFGHAFSSLPGVVTRHDRAKHALITMGPSIVAAAVTTIAASVAMVFASINFFHKFGNILLWSLVMGIVGSMFVFIVLVDIFGPDNPGGLCSRKVVRDEDDANDDEADRSSSESLDGLPLRKHAKNLKHELDAGFEAIEHRSKLPPSDDVDVTRLLRATVSAVESAERL